MELEFYDALLDDTDTNKGVDWTHATKKTIEYFMVDVKFLDQLNKEEFVDMIFNHYITVDDKLTKILLDHTPFVNDRLYAVLKSDMSPEDMLVVNNFKDHDGFEDMSMPIKSVYVSKTIKAIRLHNESGVKIRTFVRGDIVNICGFYIKPTNALQVTTKTKDTIIDTLYVYSNELSRIYYTIDNTVNKVILTPINVSEQMNDFMLQTSVFESPVIRRMYGYNKLNTEYDSDAARSMSIFNSVDNGDIFFQVYTGVDVSLDVAKALTPVIKSTAEIRTITAKFNTEKDIALYIYALLYGKKKTSEFVKRYDESDRNINMIMTKKETKAIEDIQKTLDVQRKQSNNKNSMINKLRASLDRKNMTNAKKTDVFTKLWEYVEKLGEVVLRDDGQYTTEDGVAFACEHEYDMFVNNVQMSDLLLKYGSYHNEQSDEYACCKYCGRELAMVVDTGNMETYREDNRAMFSSENDQQIVNFHELIHMIEFALVPMRDSEQYSSMALRNIVKTLVFQKTNELEVVTSEALLASRISYWTLLYSVGIVTHLLITNKTKFDTMSFRTTKERVNYMLMYMKKERHNVVSGSDIDDDFKDVLNMYKTDIDVQIKLSSEPMSVVETTNIVDLINESKEHEFVSNVTGVYKGFIDASMLLNRYTYDNETSNDDEILPIVNMSRSINALLEWFYVGTNMLYMLPRRTYDDMAYHNEYMLPTITQYRYTRDADERKISRVVINGHDMSYGDYVTALKHFSNLGSKNIDINQSIGFYDIYSGNIELYDSEDTNIIELREYSDDVVESIKGIMAKERIENNMKTFKKRFCDVYNIKCTEDAYNNYINEVPQHVVFDDPVHETSKKRTDDIIFGDKQYKDVYSVLTRIGKVSNANAFISSLVNIKHHNSYESSYFILGIIDSLVTLASVNGVGNVLRNRYSTLANDAFNDNSLPVENKTDTLLTMLLSLLLDVSGKESVFLQMTDLIRDEYEYSVLCNADYYIAQQDAISKMRDVHLQKMLKMSHLEKLALGLTTGTFEDQLSILVDLTPSDGENTLDLSANDVEEQFDDSLLESNT